MTFPAHANLNLIPTFSLDQQAALQAALLHGFDKNPAHALATITSYEETHAHWILGEPVPSDRLPLKLRDWSQLPTRDAFAARASQAAERYAEVYNHYTKPPFRFAIDSSFLYNHHEARGETIAPWDGEGGLEGWEQYQKQHTGRLNKGEIPTPGRGFEVVKRLLGLNHFAYDPNDPETSYHFTKHPLVMADLISRRSPDTAERIMRALAEDFGIHFDLGMKRFSYGQNLPFNVHRPEEIGGPVPNLDLLKPHVAFLSSDYWAMHAAKMGLAAFFVKDHDVKIPNYPFVKLSFDCDGVIIDDWSEREFQTGKDWREQLDRFNEHERANVDVLPNLGPAFISFLGAYGLSKAFSDFPIALKPFRLGVNTARGAWGQTRINSALSLMGLGSYDELEQMGGNEKQPLLRSSGTLVHFEDGPKHFAKAYSADVIGALILAGIQNEAAIERLLKRGY